MYEALHICLYEALHILFRFITRENHERRALMGTWTFYDGKQRFVSSTAFVLSPPYADGRPIVPDMIKLGRGVMKRRATLDDSERG